MNYLYANFDDRKRDSIAVLFNNSNKYVYTCMREIYSHTRKRYEENGMKIYINNRRFLDAFH